MKSPQEIVKQMLEKDSFSKWLGIEVISVELGRCSVSCSLKTEMLNGFQIAHGGIAYSLADSCLAFAANTYGKKCVSVETSISHFKKVYEGEFLLAESIEISRGKSVAVYQVNITNDKKQMVALFKGTVLISTDEWK